jgi:hypothetical protein
MHSFARRLALVCAASIFCGLGCAGVKERPGTGTGGSGGSPFGFGGSGLVGTPAMIPGLTALTVAPKESTVVLTGTGATPSGTAQLTATGVVDGASMDVSARVGWASNLPGATVAAGSVNITAPGRYTITATSGTYSDTATVVATYSGEIVGDGFPSNGKGSLDGSPGGAAATLAYPLDHTLFPANLAPIYAHIGGATGATVARLRFEADGLEINYYGKCETGMPGAGCYVKLPQTVTRLLIATSASQDIKLTARVSKGTGAPQETASVSVAWAPVPLSGGLYYWSVIPNPPKVTSEGAPPTPGKYILLDPKQTNGTAVFRYDFGAQGDPAPEVIWTDDGGPKSDPSYQGAPQAFNDGVGKGHCIGCHAISNDGAYMALTIGGSAPEAANFALLDIAKQSLVVLNPSASTDPNSTYLNNPTDYWKKFRMEKLASENAWGPNSDVMVSMFQSKLYLTRVAVTGTMGTATRAGSVIPSWKEYASDPFWSYDGSLFVFTSFDMPSTGMYNETGLNGDMKKRGKIGIATASATGVNDDARELVPRAANITSYYPAISHDSKLVVFNRSTCGTASPDLDPIYKTVESYGSQTCDGYDDSSATLWAIDPAPGSTAVSLDRANGTGANGNSWPRFSPDKGTFRGKDLYWVAFSSRRAYGMQVNPAGTAPVSTVPQLWVAGVFGGGGSDPSFAPAWLPAQNTNQATPNGNHVPQWVKVAIVID